MISYSNNYALLQRLDNAGSVDTSRRQKKLRKTERDMEKDNRGRSKENGENPERSRKGINGGVWYQPYVPPGAKRIGR